MNGLNESQNRAVNYVDGHLLIVAGPGTGKTHTLTHRILRYSEQLKSSQSIMAMTFTNKAAEEMRERLHKQLNASCMNQVFVGTFHQWCLQFLKDHPTITSLPEDFTVADPEDIPRWLADAWPDVTAKEIRQRCDQVSRWKSSEFDQEVPDVVKAYNQIVRSNQSCDFDDVLLETFIGLQDHPELLNHVHQSYPYLFVDEYQDINRIQHSLLKLLVGSDSCITAIGDPNQAIYGFRGSDVAFFYSFEKDFSGAMTLSLSENYRSSENLLMASSQIMAKSSGDHVPELTAKMYEEGRLTIHQASTHKAEAEYVVHQIEKMIGGTSMFSHDSERVDTFADGEVSFGDIAVLYRLNSQAHALKQAFDRMGIPYFVSGEAQADEHNEDDELADEVCPSRGADLVVDHERVALMTLHASKGLEFPVVFIVGCEEKLMPLNVAGLVSDVEEERRLFYVGMTRAKRWLYLLHVAKRALYGKRYEPQVSRFLQDIQEDLKNYDIQKRKAKPKPKEDSQMTLFS